jgi:hypothetical protein
VFKLIAFVVAAVRCGRAYIDVDGTLLKSFVVPETVPENQRLWWWSFNLVPTPRIWSRIALCCVLRLLGVRLVIWTNRRTMFEPMTRQALGVFQHLFSEWWFMGGWKETLTMRRGVVMDDQAKYVELGFPGSLCVRER